MACKLDAVIIDSRLVIEPQCDYHLWS